MLITALFLGASQAAASRATGTWKREARAGIVNTPAVYVPDVISDFQKNNVSGKWAEGQPKEWGTEEAKYQIRGMTPGSSAWADITADEK
jgi:hypothetical protein